MHLPKSYACAHSSSGEQFSNNHSDMITFPIYSHNAQFERYAFSFSVFSLLKLFFFEFFHSKLRLRTYRILATTADAGLIETIPDAVSVNVHNHTYIQSHSHIYPHNTQYTPRTACTPPHTHAHTLRAHTL